MAKQKFHWLCSKAFIRPPLTMSWHSVPNTTFLMRGKTKHPTVLTQFVTFDTVCYTNDRSRKRHYAKTQTQKNQFHYISFYCIQSKWLYYSKLHHHHPQCLAVHKKWRKLIRSTNTSTISQNAQNGYKYDIYK